MHSNLYVNVKKRRNDFSQREKKILSVLMLNIAVQANLNMDKAVMILKEQDGDDEDLLNYKVVFESVIERENIEVLKRKIALKVTKALKMCGIDGFRISYKDIAS